jgi:hypothetical protein
MVVLFIAHKIWPAHTLNPSAEVLNRVFDEVENNLDALTIVGNTVLRFFTKTPVGRKVPIVGVTPVVSVPTTSVDPPKLS